MHYDKNESESIGFCLGICFRSVFEIPFIAFYCGDHGLTHSDEMQTTLPAKQSLFPVCILKISWSIQLFFVPSLTQALSIWWR